MALPSPLLGMCRHTMIVEPYAGSSASGAKAYSSGVTYSCRTVWKRTIVKNGQGMDVVSQGHSYVAADVQIDPKSRITLSSGSFPASNSSQPPIITVCYYPDATSNGLSHAVVYL